MFRMLLVASLLAVVLGAAPVKRELDDEWMLFKKTYNKVYLEEESHRRLIWESNLAAIQKHNLQADRGLHTHRLGMNQFGDMTGQEIRRTLNGFRMSNSTKGQLFMAPSNVATRDVPDTVDWRKKGYVTAVKNQANCGSCWAFSSTGSLEGQHFRKTGKLVSLSEQNLVDCSQKEGNQGCNGGNMDQSFEYVRKNGGIDTEDSYPYTQKMGTCRFKKNDILYGATDSGYVDIQQGSEQDLKMAVATVGPISVALDASALSFHFYKSGVYSTSDCSKLMLDHAVTAIGYGTFEGKDYWLLKNSWGTTWGMDGFVMFARNNDNMCGIATAASFPRV
ncbi:hypothetical protein ScPMuIL_002756 [Solemya velum]